MKKVYSVPAETKTMNNKGAKKGGKGKTKTGIKKCVIAFAFLLLSAGAKAGMPGSLMYVPPTPETFETWALGDYETAVVEVNSFHVTLSACEGFEVVKVPAIKSLYRLGKQAIATEYGGSLKIAAAEPFTCLSLTATTIAGEEDNPPWCQCFDQNNNYAGFPDGPGMNQASWPSDKVAYISVCYGSTEDPEAAIFVECKCYGSALWGDVLLR